MAKLLHSGPISTVAAQGTLWASGGYDNRIILWDTRFGQPQALAQGVHDHLVNHCEFSPDGRHLVSAGSDYTARIWSLPALTLQTVLSGHGDDVDMAVFSPDSQWVATCALDRAVRVFDLTGRCHHTFLGHAGNIISLLWRPDGRTLVSSGVDGTVREWSLDSGTQANCHDLQGIRTDTIVTDTLGRILAGDDRGRIAILTDGPPRYLQAHQAGVKKLVFSAEERVLVSLSYDRTLAIWSLGQDGALTEQQRAALPALIWSRAAAVLTGGRLLVGTFGTRPAVYDWRQDRWELDGIEAGNSINAVTIQDGHCFTVGDAGVVRRDGQPWAQMHSLCNFLVAAGSRLFTGGQLGQLFDAHTGALVFEFHSPLNCGTTFTRAGRLHLAVGTYTGELLIFDHADGDGIGLVATIAAFGSAVKGLTCNGDLLFAVCASTAIAWYDCASLTLTRAVAHAHDKIANACACAGPGRVATVARDRTLRLWSDQATEVHLTPHPNSVKCLAASLDGTRLLTGSYGGTIAAFDLPSRAWTRFERISSAGIASITFDPAHDCFIAADYDGGLHVVH